MAKHGDQMLVSHSLPEGFQERGTTHIQVDVTVLPARVGLPGQTGDEMVGFTVTELKNEREVGKETVYRRKPLGVDGIKKLENMAANAPRRHKKAVHRASARVPAQAPAPIPAHALVQIPAQIPAQVPARVQGVGIIRLSEDLLYGQLVLLDGLITHDVPADRIRQGAVKVRIVAPVFPGPVNAPQKRDIPGLVLTVLDQENNEIGPSYTVPFPKPLGPAHITALQDRQLHQRGQPAAPPAADPKIHQVRWDIPDGGHLNVLNGALQYSSPGGGTSHATQVQFDVVVLPGFEDQPEQPNVLGIIQTGLRQDGTPAASSYTYRSRRPLTPEQLQRVEIEAALQRERDALAQTAPELMLRLWPKVSKQRFTLGNVSRPSMPIEWTTGPNPVSQVRVDMPVHRNVDRPGERRVLQYTVTGYDTNNSPVGTPYTRKLTRSASGTMTFHLNTLRRLAGPTGQPDLEQRLDGIRAAVLAGLNPLPGGHLVALGAGVVHQQ